jgi:hypothetical protein
MDEKAKLRAKKKEFSMKIPSKPGIYIAQPIGKRMRFIDKSRPEMLPLVNNEFIKVGKTKDLKRRGGEYFRDNDGDVKFEPVIIMENYSQGEINKLEKMLKKEFIRYRVINPKINKGRLEWMKNISSSDALIMINQVFKQFRDNILITR